MLLMLNPPLARLVQAPSEPSERPSTVLRCVGPASLRRRIPLDINLQLCLQRLEQFKEYGHVFLAAWHDLDSLDFREQWCDQLSVSIGVFDLKELCNQQFKRIYFDCLPVRARRRSFVPDLLEVRFLPIDSVQRVVEVVAQLPAVLGSPRLRFFVYGSRCICIAGRSRSCRRCS